MTGHPVHCIVFFKSHNPVHTVLASLTYESHASAQDEEPVEAARLHELVGLVLSEAARVAEEVDEGDGDAAVHVQDLEAIV